MMKRWIILLLAASVLIIFGSSMTNGAEDLLEEIFPSIEESSGEIIQSEEIFTEEIPIETGQILTSLPAISEGYENLPLSVELDSGTIEQWNDGTIASGTIEEVISDPISHLIISEVYFDGTDEWIEITNIGDGDFQGNFMLVGVKSTALSLVNISILSGESKLFGDNLSQISGNVLIGKTGLAFNILDTAPINIQLSISGQVEDSFLVDTYWVNLYNDKKTSFEKVGGVSTRVQTGRISNAQSGYTINPGTYFGSGTVSDVSFPLVQNSGDLQLPIPCVLVDQRDLIKINEIFPGNENYPAFIELVINDDIFIDSLSISGSLLNTGLMFSWNTGGTTLQKNSFLLLSSTGFRNTEGIQSVRNDDFSLVSTGNWLLITIGSGQNRQVMDIVYHSGDMLGNSLYFEDTSLQCARVLDVMDYFSPGFERKFLKYLSGQTFTKIEYREVFTGNQSELTGCLLSGQNELFSGEIQETTSGSLAIDQYTIRIVDVDYDPEGSDTNNEKVTLLATHISGDKTPLDLSKIFRLKVNGTNKTLPWTLPINISTTFIKTFGFPNSTKDGSDVIIQLTYGDKIFDTYTYNPNIKDSEKLLTGEIESTGTMLDFSGLNFSISYVLPNPKGSDTNEEIGIKIYREQVQGTGNKEIFTGKQNLIPSPTSQVPEKFDLSQGFSLKVGSRSKKLSGMVFVGQENIVIGSLGLVNKAACVSLMYKEKELDVFCYPSPKEGQKIYSSFVDLETVTENDLEILNKLTIKRVGNTLCTTYLGSTIICKRIPASKAEKKTINEKNLYKGFSTFIKNYLIDDWSAIYYDTKVRSYFDMLSTNKSLIANGISTIKIYGQSVSVTSIKKQIEVIENTAPVIIAAYEGIQALRQK